MKPIRRFLPVHVLHAAWAAGVSLRSMTAVAAAWALAIGTLSAVVVVATPTASDAAPGSPGTPGAPTVLYLEDFENAGNNTNVALTDYVGDAGTTYTGSTFWTTRAFCNGFVIDRGSPRNPADCSNGNSPNAPAFYDTLTALPRALGLAAGLSSAAADVNGAASSYTAGSTADNEIQFATVNPIALPAANRFVTFSVDAGAQNCFATHPKLRFYLKNAAGTEVPVSNTAIDPCTDSRARVIASETASGAPSSVSAGTFAADSSTLVSGNSLGIVLRNENGSGGGNDGAYDNIRVLDVTPQLDKSFSPARVPTGGTSTLTLTVTNTSELAAKSGWAFTDNLPAGLVVADPNGVGGTCDATTTAAPGSSDIEITDGQLAAGQESCTITVDVTSATPTGADPSPKTYQNCAANITDVVGMNLPACASVEFFSTPELTIDKTSDATTATRVGDTVTYTVKATNTGDGDYTAANPASVLDDLTEVLDDATYNNDAAADRGVAPAYQSPRVKWSGALAVGQSVTITYSVTLKSGGDGTVTNAAFQSACDARDASCNPTPPATCTNNVDPATGLACDSTSFDLPKLTIDKSADRTTLPRDGEVIHYTVVATNTGPGDYTAAAPAYVVDDLTDVIDDGTLDQASITTSRGTAASYTAPRITWSGALAAGESVTIEYDVTYDQDKGDQRLVNVAFGPTPPGPDDPPPATPTCDPAVDNVDATTGEPCDRVSVPGSNLDVTKSVDPATGSTVTAGQTLTYTLTFDNDGQAAADVGYTDYLTEVLDDADVTGQPTSSSTSLVASAVTGGSFTVRGSLAANTTETVTYTVKVKADGDRGDDRLDNFLAESDDPPPGPDTVCATGDRSCTTNPVSQIEDSKSVDPTSTTDVQPGQVLTYTLTFKNVGQGSGAVDRVDDVTHVVDDATIVKDPAASDPSLKVSSISGNRFAVTGTVDAGRTVTVTYQVRVKAAGDLGDKQLGNFLLDPKDPPPGGPEDCKPGNQDCTSNPVGDIVAEKSVEPGNFRTVDAGDELTYTLTFTNTGKGKAPVAYTDDLTGVLDDADLVSGPTASDPALTVRRSGDALDVTGTLAAGQKATVTYSVRVREYADQGDHRVLNFLVVTGQEPPTSCTKGDVLCTSNLDEVPPPPAGGGSGDGGGDGNGFLPNTGAGYALWTAPIGLLMLVLGTAVVARERRRRLTDPGTDDLVAGGAM
jgi:uncharacterized repeat protein (TIGR01451 family)